jgi:uncharacterized RDD family membrane protein YckC
MNEMHQSTPLNAENGAFPVTVLPVQGVLLPRIGAWIVDAVIVFVITWLLLAMVMVVSVFTFGVGLVLVPATGFVAALGYAALTIGGRRQATLGMRMAGIKVVRGNGGRPDGLAAAVHALLFWVALGTVVLLMADIAFGLLREDRRLGHDLLADLAVIRA